MVKKMIKKKMPFIMLAVSFGAITLLMLFFTWGNNPNTTPSTMMGQSMGSMMGGMHLSNVTVSDLIISQEQKEGPLDTGNQESHHSQGGFLKIAHYLTTGTIVLLLPFILAGTIFLAIIWFSKPSEVKR